MNDLIDRNKLIRKAQRVAVEAWKMKMTAPIETTLNQFIDWVKEAPTIDAVEVVRCKDCKYRKACCRPCYKSADSYCSDGERKETDHE